MPGFSPSLSNQNKARNPTGFIVYSNVTWPPNTSRTVCGRGSPVFEDLLSRVEPWSVPGSAWFGQASEKEGASSWETSFSWVLACTGTCTLDDQDFLNLKNMDLLEKKYEGDTAWRVRTSGLDMRTNGVLQGGSVAQEDCGDA